MNTVDRCAAIMAHVEDIQRRFKELLQEFIETADNLEAFVIEESKDDPELRAQLTPMIGEIRFRVAEFRKIAEANK